MRLEDDNFGEMEGMECETENNGNETMETVETDQFIGLPKTLFACNVHESVFNNARAKQKFEFLFRRFGMTSFIYLPSFRRVRVTFESAEEATDAKICLHHTDVNGKTIELYFAQAKAHDEGNTPNLLPPKPEKQFLISPPASPPIGWEPIEENKPAFNFDLLSAVVNMVPGQVHELHRGTEVTPSVVVHVCEDSDLSGDARLKIPQTRRPGN